ncbi:DUF6941 family protein [Leucobacter sp. HY1908]
MKISVYTADFAQTDERGKLNAIGLGWTTVPTPLPAHSIAILFELDWHEANEVKSFSLELVDADGHLLVTDENGQISAVDDAHLSGSVPLLRLEGSFEVGRPPGLTKGTPLSHALAVNLPGGMPLDTGRYTYQVRAQSVTGEQSFSVVSVL